MSSLQRRLYDYEQTPPEKTWDKIAAALDESHMTDEFPSKIYNAEVPPPIIAWNKIAISLDTEDAVVNTKLRRRYSFQRFAAAAVMIGLISFAVIKWVNVRNNSPENVVAINKDTTVSVKRNDAPVQESTIAPVAEDQQNSVAQASDGDGVVKTKTTKKQKPSPDNTETSQPVYAYNEHTPKLADRYIMLMTPDGGIIRMSKKWENLVCCVSGQEQDPDCKDQLKKWQEKLACSPVAASNFMDIFSLVNTLNTTEL